jgi:hypothetical protein
LQYVTAPSFPAPAALVGQLQIDTGTQRLPRQIVLPKKASPVATMRAIVASARRSRSASVAPDRPICSIFVLFGAKCQQP